MGREPETGGNEIYSKHHFLTSVVIGLIWTTFGDGGLVYDAALVGFVTFVGVFIDLDHFVIARFRTGNWNSLLYCLRNPVQALLVQDGIFERGDVGSLRWLSHSLLAGAIVTATAAVSPFAALATAVVLYVHLVSDMAYEYAFGEREPVESSRPTGGGG